jgi:hypothetical protein
MPAVEIGIDGDLVFLGSASEPVVPARAKAIRTMRGPVLGSVAWPEYSWPMF